MTPSTATRRWEDLDQATREEFDARFIEELANWQEIGLSDEGIRVYLEYRRERPDAAITTYEEGRIHKMLRPYTDPSERVDPVEAEEHIDAVEVLGAKRFHLTNVQTYGAIMLVLTLVAFVVFLVWVG
ncbi:MAG: hypothetical protein GY725_10620 [bacterium]|nr:hypothetical protein [bacterium]